MRLRFGNHRRGNVINTLGWKRNKGNLVNRIGLARRRMVMAYCVAVVAIGIAIMGWSRPVTKVQIDRNECEDWCLNNK